MNKIKKINKIKKTMACSLALMVLMIMGSTETLAVESTRVANSAGEDSKSPGKPLTPAQSELLLNTRDILQETCHNIPNLNDSKSTVSKFKIFVDKVVEENVELFNKHEGKKISDQDFKPSYLKNMHLQIGVICHGLRLQNEMMEKLLSSFTIDFEQYSKEFSSIDDLNIENLKQKFFELKTHFENNNKKIEELHKFWRELDGYMKNADYSKWEEILPKVETQRTDAFNAIAISKTYYEDFENTLMQVRDRMDDYIKTHKVVKSTQVANSAGEDSKSPGKPLTPEQSELLLNTRNILHKTYKNIPDFNYFKNIIKYNIDESDAASKENVELFNKHEGKKISDQNFKPSYLENMRHQINNNIFCLKNQNDMMRNFLSPLNISFEIYNKDFSSIDDLNIQNVEKKISEMSKQIKSNDRRVEELKKFIEKLSRYIDNADYSQWDELIPEFELQNSRAFGDIGLSETYYEDFEDTLMQVRDRMDDYIKTHRVKAPEPSNQEL